jgi:hypothetical protein
MNTRKDPNNMPTKIETCNQPDCKGNCMKPQHDAPRVPSHTPTPWDAMEGKTLIHIETANKDDGSPCGEHIASLPKVRKEDAAFIVKCVNSHERNVMFLKRALQLMEMDCPEAHRSFIGQLKDQISKAEGK